MLRTILVGLDGSAYSDAAVALGIEWAQQYNCLLVGLGVIDEPTIRRPTPVPAGAQYYKQLEDERRLHDARRQVDQFLERFTLRCVEAGVSHKLLEDVGLPHEQILTESQRYDLVLLGQETYFQFETSDAADETLRHVLQSASRPVVVVPKEPAEGGAIVVAYDGSQPASRAIYGLVASRLGTWLPVHVVTIGESSVDSARCSERAIEFLRFHDIEATPHRVPFEGDVGRTLLDQSAALGARLIVMGCYSRSALREFFIGSATKSVLRDARVPLFLQH